MQILTKIDGNIFGKSIQSIIRDIDNFFELREYCYNYGFNVNFLELPIQGEFKDIYDDLKSQQKYKNMNKESIIKAINEEHLRQWLKDNEESKNDEMKPIIKEQNDLTNKINGYVFDFTNTFNFESDYIGLVLSTLKVNHFEISNNYNNKNYESLQKTGLFKDPSGRKSIMNIDIHIYNDQTDTDIIIPYVLVCNLNN